MKVRIRIYDKNKGLKNVVFLKIKVQHVIGLVTGLNHLKIQDVLLHEDILKKICCFGTLNCLADGLKS